MNFPFDKNQKAKIESGDILSESDISLLSPKTNTLPRVKNPLKLKAMAELRSAPQSDFDANSKSKKSKLNIMSLTGGIPIGNVKKMGKFEN